MAEHTKIVWAWKLNHNEGNRNVSPITHSLTVQVRHILTRWDLKLAVNSAWGTLYCCWCVELRCDMLQVLCVPFSELFCLKGLCLLHFHNAKGAFKSSWHLLLRVVNRSSDSRGEIFPRSLINLKILILSLKLATKIKLGLSRLLWNVREVSQQWMAPNVFRPSHGLEESKRPLVRLLHLCN
jgi:hypothetical protein